MDKDLSDLIHDTNSSLGKITRSVEYFSKWLKDNAKQLDSIGVDVSKPHVCGIHKEFKKGNTRINRLILQTKIKRMKFLRLFLVALMLTSCQERHDDELFYNLKCKVVSIQEPTNWRSGKFSGTERMWLMQSLSDTTLYAKWNSMNDSTYYSTIVGDTVHFDYIRKDRFFHITLR